MMINKKILIVLAISLCGAAVLFGIFLLESEALVSSADMYLTVGDKVGLNVDTDAIWFGIVPPGGIGTKHINIAAEKTGEFVIKLHGELASWVSVSENNFVLNKGENRSISVLANVPFNAKKGDYNGTLEVYIRKV